MLQKSKPLHGLASSQFHLSHETTFFSKIKIQYWVFTDSPTVRIFTSLTLNPAALLISIFVDAYCIFLTVDHKDKWIVWIAVGTP